MPEAAGERLVVDVVQREHHDEILFLQPVLGGSSELERKVDFGMSSRIKAQVNTFFPGDLYLPDAPPGVTMRGRAIGVIGFKLITGSLERERCVPNPVRPGEQYKAGTFTGVIVIGRVGGPQDLNP